MFFRDSTYSVLLVSASEQLNTATAALLPGSEFWPVVTAWSAREARRRLTENDYDLVLINAPLPDEFGTKLAADICGKTQAGVLLLVKRDLYEGVYYKVMEEGVLVLPKPTSEAVMSQTLRHLCCMRERLRRAQERQVSVEQKIEEMRILNRAKWLLIERDGMTEEDAHRTISRGAMDRRITRREMAEEILQSDPRQGHAAEINS